MRSMTETGLKTRTVRRVRSTATMRAARPVSGRQATAGPLIAPAGGGKQLIGGSAMSANGTSAWSGEATLEASHDKTAAGGETGAGASA